ncbi:hypothetical protein G4B88_027788 [Cannabis sativa]|uniref:RNase H type-1 domain-containing protein n=1 Tax=Cannabis sativa TaxID=3483 RepID=A0A7J6EHS7_CANSA|nr:hypothetical protein G4B88_027788 [Cannabis sativa]
MCKVDTTVGDLMLNSGEGWIIISLSFGLDLRRLIVWRVVDFGTLLNEDKLHWKSSPDGSFSIKRAYWDLNRSRFFEKDVIGSRIWKLKMHERVKLFLWKFEGDTVSHLLPIVLFLDNCGFPAAGTFGSPNFSLVSGKDIVSWLIDPPFAQHGDEELSGAQQHSIMFRATAQEGINRGPAAIQWGLPRPGRMKCYVDFASDNEVGVVAGVIYDWEGSVKSFGAKKVTASSSFQGELEALAFGVEMARSFAAVGVDFHSDNWQLVNSLSTGRCLWWNASFSFNKILSELEGFNCSFLGFLAVLMLLPMLSLGGVCSTIVMVFFVSGR